MKYNRIDACEISRPWNCMMQEDACLEVSGADVTFYKIIL